jgi:putative tryptophan/tyrosine transport system substrate-binding protein
MAKMPLFTFSPAMVKRGAVLGIGSDYRENGRDAGLIVADVICGKEPSRIPFHGTDKISRSVNLGNARRLGVTIPAEWVKTANLVVPSSQPTH